MKFAFSISVTRDNNETGSKEGEKVKYVLLVSHGEFARGLKSSLEMFAGDKAAEVIAMGLEKDETADHFGERFGQQLAEIDESDSLVILADIIGGSPLTTVCNILAEKERLQNVPILGGMNLPMALNAILLKDSLSGQAFVDTVLKEAGTALQQFKTVTEEEDDI